MDKIKKFEEKRLKKDLPKFNIGDTVKVYVKIKEEDKTRTQAFEGIVIGKKGTGIKQTFIVRKISFGEGIERVFPVHSPLVEKVEVIRPGKVRRAKLYYLRERVGKATKVEERFGEAIDK